MQHWAERVPWERIILGIAVIWGFVAIINFMLTTAIPEQNREIVLSMTAVLGTALGAVIGAVFRQNSNDEVKNRTIETLANTAAAPLTTTTTTEVTGGQVHSDQATGGSARLAESQHAAPIEPLSDDDSPADPVPLPASPPGLRP